MSLFLGHLILEKWMILLKENVWFGEKGEKGREKGRMTLENCIILCGGWENGGFFFSKKQKKMDNFVMFHLLYFRN